MKFQDAVLFVLGLCSVSSCVSRPPDPVLIAAAANPNNPSAISGSALQACKDDTRIFWGSPHWMPEAQYAPTFTLQFAQSLAEGKKKVAAYADRIRAYRANYVTKTIFGRYVTRNVFCYYEMQDGNLRYLVSIVPDERGRVDMDVYNTAVTQAYFKMAGKVGLKAQIKDLLTN